jgi:subtilisin family serine protease
MTPDNRTPGNTLVKNILILSMCVLAVMQLSDCGPKPSPETDTDDETGTEFQEVPNQYVIVLNNKPVIKHGKQKNSDRKVQQNQNESIRVPKRDSILTIINQYNLSVPGNHIMTDILVGFKARLTQAQVNQMRPDSRFTIYPDFEIKLRNPIQQSEPIASRNPIQQDYDIVNPENGLTCAIHNAGGPKDGSAKPAYVWILDTGVQLDHPDLNVVTDTTLAVSFVPGDTSPNDYNGHGTHVAGIIGALDNDIGSVGVSAGAKLVPVKVLENSGLGSWSYLLLGLDHVAKYNSRGDVVNLSLGAFDAQLCRQTNHPAYTVLYNALQELARDTTYIVIAAGNENKHATNSLPACMDENDTNILFAVAAVNCDNTCADYSNFGQPPLYWGAVGTNVFSTYKDSNYKIMSGTSMAAAVVSGVIHANDGPPHSDRSVTCKGKSYKLAKVR